MKHERWATTTLVLATMLLMLSLGRPTPASAAGVVGDGTPESCTEAALDAALASGGLVTFNCGSEPVTITLTGAKVISFSLTLDGDGLVTLSGGNTHRLFRSYEGAIFTLRNMTIANGNTGPGGGGAVLNQTGTITLINSTLRDNVATGPGGGIANFGGVLTLNRSTVSGNSSAERAGAIYNSGGTVTVIDSTVSGNRAEHAGGILNDGGGAVSLTNCTLAGNDATTVGGIANEGGTVSVTNSMVAASGGVTCSGPIADGSHNLQWPGTDCGSMIPSLDPLLDPAGLQDNGGPTQTIALLPGSPAINAGDPEVCTNPPVNGLDQRGYVRPGTGAANCSIGAYEYDSPGPPPPCVGDCNGDGRVTIDELITLVNTALASADVSACAAGDEDGDDLITIDEIIGAVNNALRGCPVTLPDERCVASGGTVVTGLCCIGAGDFPDTCAIGPCGCAPDASEEVSLCNCGEGHCFEEALGCVAREGSWEPLTSCPDRGGDEERT